MDTNKIIESVEKLISTIIDKDINTENVKLLSLLVDIHKDIKNEEYWKEKIKMRYRNYSEGYGRSNYGRRGNYRGDDMLEEMNDNYGEYSESKYNESRGYGHNEDSIKPLKKMLKSVEEFMCMLIDEASSKEEIELIQKTARKISDM